MERERLSTPLLAKSSQANVSLVEASIAHPRELVVEPWWRERERGREMNVTLALICHIVNHRYEENASRLNVQLRHK